MLYMHTYTHAHIPDRQKDRLFVLNCIYSLPSSSTCIIIYITFVFCDCIYTCTLQLLEDTDTCQAVKTCNIVLHCVKLLTM